MEKYELLPAHLTEKPCPIVFGVTADNKIVALKVDSNGGFLTGGLATPLHDETVITYHGTTNNVHTVVYKYKTITVGTLTISYVVGTPTVDNALVSGTVLS